MLINNSHLPVFIVLQEGKAGQQNNLQTGENGGVDE